MARAQPQTVGEHGPLDEVDPELLSLPAPPSGRRFATMALMAFVVVMALGLALSLRRDLGYFFAGSAVRDLGDATTITAASLEPNTQVRVSGTPLSAGTVRYRRVMTGASYVVFPLAGQRTVFVHLSEDEAREPRTTYVGRLVRFSDLGGRLGSVRAYLADTMDMPVTPESYVLLVDETPGTYWWAVGLAILCALFVAVDVYLIVRWFRPRAPAG